MAIGIRRGALSSGQWSGRSWVMRLPRVTMFMFVDCPGRYNKWLGCSSAVLVRASAHALSPVSPAAHLVWHLSTPYRSSLASLVELILEPRATAVGGLSGGLPSQCGLRTRCPVRDWISWARPMSAHAFCQPWGVHGPQKASIPTAVGRFRHAPYCFAANMNRF